MLVIALRFWVPLVVLWLYALRRGGGPERWAVSLLLLAGVLTLLVERSDPGRFASVEVGVLLVDLALLAGLVSIALTANRYWPLALASLHLMTVIGPLGKWLNPELLRLGYAIMIIAPAYPGLIVVAAGVFRHGRRVRRYGVDRSWSFPRRRGAG